jgi:3-hydroxy acid dehydrogenase / malonic semialdehyde reductase
MKTILITGATSGIGQAIAERFAKEKSCRLILTGRRLHHLEQLKKIDAPIHTLCFDVSDHEALLQALSSLPKEFSNVDILINNAGAAYGMDTADKCEIDDWNAMVDTNIKGLMHMTRAILPSMVARNGGHIINIGSIAASYPYTGGNVYGATKAFVHQFSKNLKADLLGSNIRVSTIAPGIVKTDFFTVRLKGNQEKAASLFRGMEALQANDIADAVFWCAHQPAHVNINLIELMPVCQAPASISIHRKVD